MTGTKKALMGFILILNYSYAEAQTEGTLDSSENIYNEKVTIDDDSSQSESAKNKIQETNKESNSGERVRVYSGKQDGVNVIYDSHQPLAEPKPKEKIRIYSGGQDGNNIIREVFHPYL